MKNTSSSLVSLLIVVVAALLFLPFLGSVHLFDWDENIFAESAREMLVTGNFYKVQSNFQPFQEKPPFFFWLQALSMTIFGVNEFAARFPNAIVGIVTLVLLYSLGSKYFNQKFGLYWALAYIGSFLPHFYFRTALIDPTFNLFIFSGVFTLALFATTSKEKKTLRIQRVMLAGTLIGFAILTKGPVAFLIAGLTAFFFLLARRDFTLISGKEILLFALPMLTVACAWFGIEVIINGPWFIKEFIEYQLYVLKQPHSGHSGPFYYHFLVLLLGCFPVSLFIFKAFKGQDNDNFQQRNIKLAMILMMAVVLLIFSIVKTKLVHYSSLCYFPISFLAAYVLDKYEHKRIQFGNGFRFAVLGLGIIVSVVLFAASYILVNKDALLAEYGGLIKDAFAVGNLQTPVKAGMWELATGIIFFLAIVYFVVRFKSSFIHASIVLFVATIITVQLTTYSLVPKIETMVQGEAINFYREKGKEDVYIHTYGFKSFAYLFYGLKKPEYRPESLDENWLLHGDIDKPVYIVTKAYEKRLKVLDTIPGLKKLYSKSGYAFYKREVASEKSN